jgi:hypothetical protein
MSQLPCRATISYNNPLAVGIETIERHRATPVASESGSPTLILVNATTFTNNAG